MSKLPALEQRIKERPQIHIPPECQQPTAEVGDIKKTVPGVT
jgi:hypothetical protein